MSISAASRRNSILIAAGIAVAFAAWILSGLGRDLPAGDNGEAETRTTAMRVTVRHSTAKTTTRTIVTSARTEPDRAIELKAETEGRVVSIGAERGSLVKAGQAIVALDLRDREARLAEADALVHQRELEYAAAQRLRGQGFNSEAQLAAAAALLESARASQERIALDIRHTKLTAPFDAVVDDRSVEIGDYVSIGDTIARLVDADPLIVVGNINERDIGALELGSTGRARVLGGTDVEGRVRYLAPVADESTRSFRVELAIPNPELKVRVGTSAELMLGGGQMTAHELSPALLTLADDGTIGIKTVDDSSRVLFLPVDLVGSGDEGILVTGLPVEVTIITVGQGFVADGQAVIPVEESTALTQARNERAY